LPALISGADFMGQVEQPGAKKRKRVPKKEEVDAADSPGELISRRSDDNDASETPISTDAERALIAQFNKRSAAAKAKFPSIAGGSFLVSTATIKLPSMWITRRTPVLAIMLEYYTDYHNFYSPKEL
jgi:hypothetical protein